MGGSQNARLVRSIRSKRLLDEHNSYLLIAGQLTAMTHVPWHHEQLDDASELHGFESVELTSVGIDIGTTTTHLMFSRLLARRETGAGESTFRISEREPLYYSPIRLTPFRSESTIDVDEIDEFIRECYDEAGLTPSDIDTGAVIVTGEASRRENAELISSHFSERAGKFVCAIAGPNLEALLAAHGSGAVEHAYQSGSDIIHLDIGGGTTKFAYIVDGVVEATESINVGARLVSFDERGTIAHVELAGTAIADDIGLEVAVGESIAEDRRERFAARSAELILEVLTDQRSELAEQLMVSDRVDRPVGDLDRYDLLTFSGGVAEYVHDRSPEFSHDLGEELGHAIRDIVIGADRTVSELETGIRATVMGSTQHSMQVSGNTISISQDVALPMRNVPIIPMVVDESIEPAAFAAELTENLALYDADELRGGFAFGFHLHGRPSSPYLNDLVDAIIRAWPSDQDPIILVFDSDVALNVGEVAKAKVDRPIVSLDGIDLQQFGYIDIGEPIQYTDAVPITIKSLVFEG